MDFVPSAKRQFKPFIGEWTWGDKQVDFNNFEIISVAAYLKEHAESPTEVFKKNCEILFVMAPIVQDQKIGWEIEIIPSTERSLVVKQFIIDKYNNSGDNHFYIY